MTDIRNTTPPKGLVLKSGLFWAPPTPEPPEGQASHELLEAKQTRTCEQCGKPLPRHTSPATAGQHTGKARKVTRTDTRYCSPKCRKQAWREVQR